MRRFSLVTALTLAVFTVSACQGAESEVPVPQVNQLVVDTMAELPRSEISECLAAAEWIHFYKNSLGRGAEANDVIAVAIKSHWMAAYKQAFSLSSVSPKSVLKESDFRLDQNGLNKAGQMAVRDERINTCMAYSTDALIENGFEVNMGEKS